MLEYSKTEENIAHVAVARAHEVHASKIDQIRTLYAYRNPFMTRRDLMNEVFFFWSKKITLQHMD